MEKGYETHLDLSGLADDAGQPVELIHEGLELIHCQFGAITTALRAQAAAAGTDGKTVMVELIRDTILICKWKKMLKCV